MFGSQNGRGCEGYMIREVDGIVHNPKPSTERGKRKHEGRNEQQKNNAQIAWDRPRSTKPSKKQLELMASQGGRKR